MIPDRQWQQDMIDGVEAAHQANLIGPSEVLQLLPSIKEPINHHQMDLDTCQRTGGACPTERGYLQRQFTKLAGAVEKLRTKWR